MNPVAILYALSISCFLVAACMFVYWLHDLRQLRRGLREDAQLDRLPIRSGPEWMRKTSKNRP